MTLKWHDFRRPSDDQYFEVRFRYLSQGDILLDAPMLVPSAPLLVEETTEGERALRIPVVQTDVMIISPTCDFRRPSAAHLDARPDEDPYQLRQQVVVARILPIKEWETAQPATGRSDRVDQMLSFDNLRQYMYLPPVGSLGQSMVDLATMWTLPFEVALGLERLTQLAEAAARQLQYKLVIYATASVVDRDSLRPPMD
jgi:hypothetical protein